MTANKMPEMPEAGVRFVALTHDIHFADGVEVTGETLDLYTADQMRAMWLAGIAAAQGCVPEPDARGFDNLSDRIRQKGFNNCRTETLANLSALEQGVRK